MTDANSSTGKPSSSPFVLITRLMTDIKGKLVAFDVDMLERSEQRIVKQIKGLLADGRLDIRDYELSETRDEQLRHAAIARERLEQLRLNVLAASEHNLFSAVDVAQISAQVDEIVSNLR
jgi:hypothetical protein